MESGHRSRPAARDTRPDCVCGHGAFDHAHYRRGSDCGRCDCAAYRSGVPAPARAVAGLRMLLRRFAGR